MLKYCAENQLKQNIFFQIKIKSRENMKMIVNTKVLNKTMVIKPLHNSDKLVLGLPLCTRTSTLFLSLITPSKHHEKDYSLKVSLFSEMFKMLKTHL